VNVALHLATALLLWRALARLRVPGAWVAGLIFAVHPVAVESVAWISELKNGLSGVLWLATIHAWITADAQRSSRWRAATLALFALALLAKVSVVVLPVVLLGVALARRGRLERRDVVEVAPLLLLAAVAAAGNVWFQHQNAMQGAGGAARGLAERIGGAGWALASYVERAFAPVRLALLYPPWPVDHGSPWFWIPLAGIAAAIAVLWRLRAGPARPLVLALGYQAVCVGPVLGLVDMSFLRLAPVSNHLQYLALMAPAALAGWALARLGARWPRAAVGALAVGALAAVTFDRSSAFADDLSLFTRAAHDAPGSAVAVQAYAHELLAAERPAEAVAALEAASAVAPDEASRHDIRSELLVLQGRTAEAAEEARAVVASTDRLDLLSDAAETLGRAGRAEEAIAVLRQLVQRAPGASEYAYRLAAALARAGRGPEAIAVLRAYCESRPGHPRMEPALALLLVRAGRLAEARARAAQVLGILPADPRAADLLRAWYRDATGSELSVP
jgi:Flp pilus assembly protein TadD